MYAVTRVTTLANMNFSFLVNRILLEISLAVVRYNVGVVELPGKLIISTPTVSLVRYVSAFYDRVLATIFP